MVYKLFLAIRILLCRILKRPLFVIKIENGIVSRVSGFAKNSFIKDCTEVAERNNLKFAFIYAENGSFGKPILKASFEVSKDTLQQFRNSWGFNS